MCTKENLRLGSLAVMAMRMCCSAYLMIGGSVIVNNFHLAQSFGDEVTVIGNLIIFAAFWNLASGALCVLGHKQHNKAILLIYIISDAMLTVMLLALGSSLYQYTVSDYSKGFKLDCLRSVPQTYTAAQCLEYLQSDRYAALSLTWRSYNALTYSYTKYYSRVIQLQDNNACCGFGPPLRCVDDTREFPSWASLKKVRWGTEERTTCGTEADWYVETDFCDQYIDDAALFLEYGGCKYDYPLGTCMDADVSDSTLGCASALEDSMTVRIYYPAVISLVICIILVWSILTTCCMFWKRSEEDKVPDFVDHHVPWDPFSSENKRKYRVGVEENIDDLNEQAVITNSIKNVKIQPI